MLKITNTIDTFIKLQLTSRLLLLLSLLSFWLHLEIRDIPGNRWWVATLVDVNIELLTGKEWILQLHIYKDAATPMQANGK